MSIFDSLVNVVSDVAKIVLAPAEIALDVTAAVTKPLADGAEELAKVAKDLVGRDD